MRETRNLYNDDNAVFQKSERKIPKVENNVFVFKERQQGISATKRISVYFMVTVQNRRVELDGELPHTGHVLVLRPANTLTRLVVCSVIG